MMRRLQFGRLVAAGLFLPLLASPVPAPKGGLSIDHAGAKCVVAERFSRLGARVSPPDDAAKVRAYFRAANTPSWYFIEMKGEGDAFAGTLPKPKKSTKQIDYYIEAISTSSAATRTSEFSPAVVGPGQCGKGDVALETEPSQKSSKIAVGSASGSGPVVPSGFSDAGVVQFTAESGAKSKESKKKEKKDSRSEKKGAEVKKNKPPP